MMARRKTRLTMVLVAVAFMSLSTAIEAQTIIEGGTAGENVRTAGARSPGNMTTAGVGRAQRAAQEARARVEITETPSTTPRFREQFAIDATRIIVDQFNQLLTFFLNRLLARAGLQPLIPTDLLPPLADVGGGDGTTDAGAADMTEGVDGTNLGDGTDGMDLGEETVEDVIDESSSPDSDSPDLEGGRRPGRRPGRG